jgi:ketosteroid isomerase-like protein
MATVEELREALEALSKKIASAGEGAVVELDNVGKAAAEADSLGMKAGKQLLDNLAASLQSVKDGKSHADSIQVRITALDFYLNKIKGGSSEEEL